MIDFKVIEPEEDDLEEQSEEEAHCLPCLVTSELYTSGDSVPCIKVLVPCREIISFENSCLCIEIDADYLKQYVD